MSWATAFSHNHNIGGHYGQKCYRRYHYYLLKMSVNGVSTIFGIASFKMERISLQPWLIIELSPAYLGKTWLWQHWHYVLNMSINRASTTFGLASWRMQGLGGNIKLSSNYRPPSSAKMIAITSPLCSEHERQPSVNDFWPCILENTRVVRWH
jgi:hypothetical protein